MFKNNAMFFLKHYIAFILMIHVFKKYNIPWPLIPLVCQRDINHSHQRFLNKGSITLAVVLF